MFTWCDRQKDFQVLPNSHPQACHILLPSTDSLYSPMADTGTPPVIPAALQLYKWAILIFLFWLYWKSHGSSYAIDPQWQRKFSIIWPSFLAFFVVLSLPHLIRSIRNGRAYNTLPGILEKLNGKKDYRVAGPSSSLTGSRVFKKNHCWVSSLRNFRSAIASVFYWTIPGFNLNAGQRSLITFLLIVWIF